MIDLNHDSKCLCLVCLLASASEEATEADDRASQRVMAARWHGFANKVEKELEQC